MLTDDYKMRKAARTARFLQEQGRKLKPCSACGGTGRYDHNRSPSCGACNGTGKIKEGAS